MAKETPRIALDDLIADPLGTLRKARDLGSVVQTDVGTLVVSHEAVRQTLQDRCMRSSFTDVLELFGVSSGAFYDWMSISPLNMDGEEHRRWRLLMQRTFTPRSVDKIRGFMRRESERLIAAFPPENECDFVEHFARKLPSLGLSELMGVPVEDRETFTNWADTIGLGLNFALCASRIQEIDAALEALLEYSQRLVDERRRDPRDDLITRIAQAADAEGGFDEERIRGSVAGLVFAGNETTKHQLSWMITALSAAPEQWDRVQREPGYARPLIEEVLRLRSSATSVTRIAQSDTEVAGCPVARGARVISSLWGANRDPAVFEEPDRIDVAKNEQSPQLAFGHGAHHCVGAALARAELQEALIALSASITCPRLLDGAAWLPPLGITGPLRLPIAFERR